MPWVHECKGMPWTEDSSSEHSSPSSGSYVISFPFSVMFPGPWGSG